MPTYKNLKYINESKNSILSNLDNNLQEQYASDLDQNLDELYNNEVRSKIEKMGDKNQQISEFLNEMYSNVDYNMDEFDPKYLKENKEKFKDIKGGIIASIIDKNNKAQSNYQLESFFEKYDQIFDKNTPHDKIIDNVASKFLELNGELYNKIEHESVYNEAELALSKTLSKNITSRIDIDINKDGNYQIHKFSKLLAANKEFRGDENIALFQTLKMMDKALMDENNKDFKAIHEKIGFNFTDKFPHATKVNNNKIANKIFIKSTETNDLILDQNEEQNKERGKGLNFKNPATIDNFEKCLKGGIEATAALAESIGDESITAFTQNLNRVAGISGIGKHINNIVSAQNNKEVINRLGKAYTEKVKSGAIKLPKEKVMEHSNQKSLGANRWNF